MFLLAIGCRVGNELEYVHLDTGIPQTDSGFTLIYSPPYQDISCPYSRISICSVHKSVLSKITGAKLKMDIQPLIALLLSMIYHGEMLPRIRCCF